jgi:hypothetical protein
MLDYYLTEEAQDKLQSLLGELFSDRTERSLTIYGIEAAAGLSRLLEVLPELKAELGTAGIEALTSIKPFFKKLLSFDGERCQKLQLELLKSTVNGLHLTKQALALYEAKGLTLENRFILGLETYTRWDGNGHDGHRRITEFEILKNVGVDWNRVLPGVGGKRGSMVARLSLQAVKALPLALSFASEAEVSTYLTSRGILIGSYEHLLVPVLLAARLLTAGAKLARECVDHCYDQQRIQRLLELESEFVACSGNFLCTVSTHLFCWRICSEVYQDQVNGFTGGLTPADLKDWNPGNAAPVSAYESATNTVQAILAIFEDNKPFPKFIG